MRPGGPAPIKMSPAMPAPDRLSGVLCPVVTPFDGGLNPDPERLAALCRWLLSQGLGLAPFGTTSEGNSLSVAEKTDLLDRLVAAGIDPGCLMPGTGADLGLLAECLYDGHDEDLAPPTALEDDVFLGVRLALNDPQDSSALAGTVFDRHSGAAIVFVEAERRLGDSWRIELEGRLFFGVPDDDPLAGLRNDSSFTLRLSRFF